MEYITFLVPCTIQQRELIILLAYQLGMDVSDDKFNAKFPYPILHVNEGKISFSSVTKQDCIKECLNISTFEIFIQRMLHSVNFDYDHGAPHLANHLRCGDEHTIKYNIKLNKDYQLSS